MPVSPTYPGVYIEEIPSGVHTVTGVSTSITAFIGYTARGPVNQPVHIFSFADYERAFGGLDVDSPLSYAVKLFFQNGGNEAYVVRVAKDAKAATVTLKNLVSAGQNVLDVAATSEGTWGNYLQIDVDYDTLNPASLFNLKVTELVEQNGQLVPGRTEVYRNLSMNSFDPSYAVAAINGQSALIVVKRNAAATYSGNGTSRSGTLATTDINKIDSTHNRIAFTLNGDGPFEFDLAALPSGWTFPSVLANIAGDIAAKITLARPPGATGVHTGTDTFFTITATTDGTHPAERSSIHFLPASRNSATEILKLGTQNGGEEADAAATVRPARTGTAGKLKTFTGLTADGAMGVEVWGTGATALATINLNLWGAGTIFSAAPTTAGQLLGMINAAFAGSSDPLLAGTTVSAIGNTLRILPGSADPNRSFAIKDVGAATNMNILGLNVFDRNVARYAPGRGITALAQVAGLAGNNGTAPEPADITGSEAAKTGIYALENVDLFNLLVIPEATKNSSAALRAVLIESIAYCTRRRAFMIIDAPETIKSFAEAQTWIGGDASSLRSRNAALYFPRLRAPDPLKNNVLGTFAAAGALAGLYARTDAERGVWKAPAGTAANIIGATGLSYTLTDKENGTLNPLGLNCLRIFPVYGTVSWGARTARGADQMADEYKYIPVRRLALFLEESLYRGTQWAVFEPNDEPLWAQIRLNLGAFMHTLFSQGAFQGRTPREAYFVKCDKETTTQNDIDLGRVNIVVGFAPLKPAEFVIIKIQQIAGAIQT